MHHTTNPQDAEPFRIPIAHSVRYVVRGLPEVPNQYGPGTLAPSEITLTYRAAPDSQLGRVHAYVAGRLWADGAEIPLLPGGLYGQHYDDGLEGWPVWLAEEARLHDPAVLPSVVVSADRATLLLDAAAECNRAGGAYAERGANEAAGAAFALMETFLRQTGEAEFAATPCDFAACEPGGEPCSVHERLMAHAEGDHELCAPDCGQEWQRRVAAEEQPTETQWPGERCGLCPPGTRTRHLEDHMVQVHGARPTEQPAETQDGDRARCPHCQMPHDLTPGSLPVAVCAATRRRIADAERLHSEGDHRLCCRADCEVVRARSAEEQPTETQATADLADRLEAALTERFTELGNPFSEMRRQEQGPDGWPASHPVGPNKVAEVLRELMADETPAERPAVAEQPDTQTREADRTVAYVLTARTELHCLRCTPNPAGDIWTPVSAEELDDGGICTACGRDVLIPAEPAP